MRARWRLIVDGPVDGALNMALDRAAQLAREEGSAPPTLRIYRWVRPTVSLGKFQAVESVDVEACRARGIDIVRRFTGGRGVLHDDEVTYCVTASVEDGVPRGVAASYRYLCGALARTYRTLGVAADVTATDRVSSSSGACYLATTRADLSFDARKLSGSAQVWAGSTVMQHGSFTMSRDVDREVVAFALPPEDAESLMQRTVTLSDLLNPAPGVSEIVEAAVRSMSEVLDIELRPGAWTPREAFLAAGLTDALRVSPPSISAST